MVVEFKDLEDFKNGCADALLKGVSATVPYEQRHFYKQGYEFGIWLYARKEVFGELEVKAND